MTEVINLILIVIIITAIVVNLILLYKARAEINQRVETAAKQISMITPSGGAITILEFAEFEKLTPEVKELYRKYIISHLLPKVMELANKELIEKKQIEELKKQLEKLASMSIQEMIQLMKPVNNPSFTDMKSRDLDVVFEKPKPRHVTGAGLTSTDGLSPAQRFRKLGGFEEGKMTARYLLSSPHSNQPVELTEEEFNTIFLQNDHLREWMALSWSNDKKQKVTVFTYDIFKHSDIQVQPYDQRQEPNITNIIYNYDGKKLAMLRDTLHVMELPM